MDRAWQRTCPNRKQPRRHAHDHRLGAHARRKHAEDRLGRGLCVRQRLHRSATGLTYQNGTAANSQYATIDISTANNVSSLRQPFPATR